MPLNRYHAGSLRKSRKPMQRKRLGRANGEMGLNGLSKYKPRPGARPGVRRLGRANGGMGLRGNNNVGAYNRKALRKTNRTSLYRNGGLIGSQLGKSNVSNNAIGMYKSASPNPFGNNVGLKG